MNEPGTSLSIVALFLHADIVVKGVLLLLLAASVWSWAVIIEKLRQLGAVSRLARGYEERAARARTAQELWAEDSSGRDHPASLMLAAGAAECADAERAPDETTGERRDRIERAMRLALNAELRRLEAARKGR